jgi:hypothetical protein
MECDGHDDDTGAAGDDRLSTFDVTADGSNGWRRC